MWATLALLTAQTGQVPPFLLMALAFGLAFLIALARWLAGGQGVLSHLAYPPEHKQRVIAAAAEMAVIGRALLLAIGPKRGPISHHNEFFFQIVAGGRYDA